MLVKFVVIMKKLFFTSILLLFGIAHLYANKTDSIGVKSKDGKIFIIHEVEKGEGLYSISKKYNVSLSALINENPGADNVIKTGQKLMIPTNRKATGNESGVITDYYVKNNSSKPTSNTGNKNEVGTFAIKHTIQKGESLYGISKKYQTTVGEIVALNNLTSNEIQEGQVLLIPSKKTEVVADNRNGKEQSVIKRTEEKVVKETVRTEQNNSKGYQIKTEKLTEYDLEKVEEIGIVTIGDKAVPVDKHYGLHHSAPEGTVIMVTNPENGQSVFVKIIGNFPRKEDSADVLRISNVTAEKLGLTKSGIFISLSYAR